MLFGGFGAGIERKEPRPRNKKHSIRYTEGDRQKRIPFSFQTVPAYTAELIDGNNEVIASGDAEDSKYEALESLVFYNPDLFTTKRTNLKNREQN